jgi:hypothetical protein
MRRLVKRAKICKHCKHPTQPPQYAWFYDRCKKLICDESQNPKENGAKQVTVFFKKVPTGKPDSLHLDFCGYKCLRQWIISYNPKNAVWFISLPYIEAKPTEKWIDKRDIFLKEFMNDNPSIR